MTNVRGFLGLIRYYKRSIAWYANITKPFFALMKKDCKFVWTPIYQAAFVELKMKLVELPILIRPNFSKPFTLDVDWSIWGVGAILSQKIGRQEQFIAYASKGLSFIHRRYHLMEGECYVFIWDIMHFR